MSKTEEYLDSLLNNVSPERKAEADRKKRRTSADFIKEFENELDDTDIDDVIEEFESDVQTSAHSEKEDDNFFGNLEGIVNSAKEASSVSQEKKSKEDSFEVNTLSDDEWIDQAKRGGEPEETENSLSGEAQEISDLLSDLPSKEEFSDIAGASRTVQQDDDNVDAEGAESGKKSKKKDKKEKKGFFEKLSKILFGEDEDELSENGENKAAASAEDEASQILKELNEAEEAGKSSGTGKKEKGKKKKEKKAKKAKKPKKEKKPKAPKPKKEKKPKKPKEVDLSPPLPKAPVILIFIMSVSAMLFVILSSNLTGYSVSITEAKKAYAARDYVKAYQTITGMNIKKSDEEFYQQALLLARVQNELVSGEGLYHSEEYMMALDSYICALGRYDVNYEEAVTYHIQKEYDDLKGQITAQLREKFDVSEEKAREIYGLRSRTEYTRSIYNIVKALGMTE